LELQRAIFHHNSWKNKHNNRQWSFGDLVLHLSSSNNYQKGSTSLLHLLGTLLAAALALPLAFTSIQAVSVRTSISRFF